MNAFLRENVDSIAYSHYDAAGNYHQALVMQRVYTKDSLYQIPLSAIDSVSLVKPQTFINKAVFRLTSAHVPYIMKGDTVSFSMKLTTPDIMRPHTGNIAVADYDCTSFPDGIMARVLAVSKKSDGYYYTCEQTGLDDVIDQIMVFEQIGLEDETANAKGNKRMAPLTKILWDKNWDTTISYSGTTTTLNAGDKAWLTLTLSKTLTTPLYVQVDVTNRMTSSIDFNAQSTASIEPAPKQFGPTITAGKIPLPSPLSFIWFEPKLSLFGYFKEVGKVELDYSGHFTRTDQLTFSYTKGKWTFSHSGNNDAGTEVAKLSMKGYAEAGLIPKVFFSVNGSKMGFGVNGQVGLRESIDFVFDATKMKDESFYGAMKDSYCRTTIPFSMTLYGNANLFARYDAANTEEGRTAIKRTFSGEKQIGEDRYILPLFSNMKYDKSSETVSYTVSRKLLLPAQVGVKVTDTEGNVVLSKTSATSSTSFSGMQSFDVLDVKAGKTYYAQPTVSLLGYTMPATPKIELKKDPELCPDGNHPHAIDLGIGVKWACCNVGASTPEGYGGYYAWGETKEKDFYNESTYQYYNSDKEKYVNIGSNISGTDYDVAHVKWGGSWRMPTFSDIETLRNNCSSVMTQQNGVDGWMFIGHNGNSIFFPIAYYREDPLLSDDPCDGRYWSGTTPDSFGSAYSLKFYDDFVDLGSYSRYYGFPVRPVSE